MIDAGAGSAATGVALQIRKAMVMKGMTKEEASENFFILDHDGLITKDRKNLEELQEYFTCLDTFARKVINTYGVFLRILSHVTLNETKRIWKIHFSKTRSSRPMAAKRDYKNESLDFFLSEYRKKIISVNDRVMTR